MTIIIIPLIILILAVLLILMAIGIYNSFIRAKTRVDETWKQIDVRLQNRYDLLPDLIQAVEKATTTDEKIQTAIAQLRSAVASAKSTETTVENADKIADSEARINSALGGLKVAVEAYPELRSQEAIQNFMNQDQLIEEKIAASRQIYNSTAREFNEKIAVVPNNIIAGMFNFKAVSYFEAKEEARADIGVDWGAGDKIVSR